MASDCDVLGVDEIVASMVSAVLGTLLFSILLRVLDPNLDIRQHQLWIESPTKCTVTSLPFFQALRVVRKRNWHLVDTQPKKKPLTRWGALKYSIGIRKGV